MNQQKFEQGDVVIIKNPDKLFTQLQDKVGVVSYNHDGYIYLEMFAPIIQNNGKCVYFAPHDECVAKFDPDFAKNGKLYFADPEELEHLTISEMDAKTMGWLYRIQDQAYAIPSDYFEDAV